MTNHSKFNDINTILKRAETTLGLIETKYNESLNDQCVPDELLAEIKDYLGNLRSALDYLANKIPIKYFPICQTEADFNNVTSGLETSLKTAIKKWQPFQNNEWLSQFSILNNKIKHVTLIPQKRKEQKTMTAKTDNVSVTMPIDNPNFSVHQGDNCQVFLGGVPVKFTNQGIIPLAPGLNREITTWISFEFDHEKLPTGISALPFLKNCFNKITKAVNEIEVFIEQ